MPPPITHCTETAIYVDDLDSAEAFYAGVLGLPQKGRKDGRSVFFQAGPMQMLLCFIAAETIKGDVLTPHGSVGPGHFALGIAPGDYGRWKQHLQSHGVAIELEQSWERGGRSIYFRDPAENSVELATPGIWGLASGW